MHTVNSANLTHNIHTVNSANLMYYIHTVNTCELNVLYTYSKQGELNGIIYTQ